MYVASRVVFACVLADASMVDTALLVDCAVNDSDDSLIPTSVPDVSLTSLPPALVCMFPIPVLLRAVLIYVLSDGGGRFLLLLLYECALSSDQQ